MEINRRLLEDLISVNSNRLGSNKRKVFKQVSSRLHDGNTSAELYGKLVTCTGNLDRVKVVKEHFKWFPLDHSIKSKYKKDAGISTAFRNLGNESLERKLFRESIFSYNFAILFAPPDSCELGLAYANRSVPLHALGMTEEALNDIQLALEKNYPKDKQSKLNIRKSSYEKLVKDRVLMNPDLEVKLAAELDKRNNFYHEMFMVKQPNPMAPAMEAFIEIKFSDTHGRLLVANENIEMGKTVLVETPFVSILKQALNWDVDHCHHCLKKILNVIPCPECVFAVYCDSTCLKEAFCQYHKYECPCMPELHVNLSESLTEGIFVFHSRSFHLMFKTVCLVGPEELYKIFVDERSITNCGRIIGSDPTTEVYENSYRPIYNLMSMIDPSEGHDFVLLSLILSRTLRDNTNFMVKIPVDQHEEFMDFIASTILHHFECFRRNVFGFSEIKDMKYPVLRPFMDAKEEPKVYYDSDGFAIATFATASLFNHSCDPNVIRFTGKRFGRTAFVALKPLKKGEELVISYGPVYGQIDDHGAKARRDILSRKYNFLCDCIACSSNWPPARELQSKPPEYCCNVCSPKFTHVSKSSHEFSQCRLLGDSFRCRLCKKQHSKKFYDKELERTMKSVEVCKMLTLSNAAPVEAIGNLKTAITFLESSVCPPNRTITFAPKIFREAVNLIVYFANSKQ